MAKVILANHWFAPGDRLFRKSPTKKGPPVDIPDDYLEFLPTTARIVPDDYVVPEKEEKSPVTISEYRKMLDRHDLARAAMVEEGAIRKEAEEADTRTRAQVKAEKKAEKKDKFEAKAKEKTDAEKDRQKAEFQERLDAEKAAEAKKEKD